MCVFTVMIWGDITAIHNTYMGAHRSYIYERLSMLRVHSTAPVDRLPTSSAGKGNNEAIGFIHEES